MTASAHISESRARNLGDSLPPLVVQAERIAATVMMGSHGLRRAGPGESFWAYRSYAFGDSTQRIDWHKSAKSDETFIRDNEWEAANTLWVWANLGPRMAFKSHLAEETKRQQAEVLALAMSALSLRAHERVGLLGSGRRASYGRHVLPQLGASMNEGNDGVLPRPATLQRRSTALLVSDFLEEPEVIATALKALAESGMRGHLVQMNDPAEESLPYEGRVEFVGLGEALRFRANKVAALRSSYAMAFLEQREAVRAIARSIGWTFTVHHTDKPLTSTVLALYHLMGAR
ncbi:MAG: DUF58 domain-containing protein [Alphaproteobacteria bacterium]|nr:DUF58 domain-containing protein [Alphaproteobacteria bacterium]